MKQRFTLLIIAAALGGSLVADAAPARMKALKKNVAPKNTVLKAPSRSAQGTLLPQTEVLSFWDEEVEEWIEVSHLSINYNPDGTVAYTIERNDEDPESALLRITYKYDENGQQIEALSEISADGEEWYNYELAQKAYDSVVTDFTVENLKYYWDLDAWQVSYGNKYRIERDAQGLLTAIYRQAPYFEGFEDIAKVENTVEDGKVVRSQVSELQSNGSELVWMENLDLRNIVWHNTDGQVLNFDVENYARGRNRIASAESYYEDELEASITGEYANDFEGSLTFNFLDDSQLLISTEYTDEATGSYMETYALSYPIDEETVVTELETLEVTFDDHGNVVMEQSTFDMPDEDIFVGGIIYDYTYNDDGVATECISGSFEMDPSEFFPEMRTQWSDFTFTTGITSVAGASDAKISLIGRELRVNASGASALRIVDLAGQTVVTASGSGSYSVSLSALQPGVYVASVSGPAGKTVQKIQMK